MNQTPSGRGGASSQHRHVRESLSEAVSLGPEPLLHTLAVTSPRAHSASPQPVNGRGTQPKSKSKLASVVHASRASEYEEDESGSASGSTDRDQRGELVDRFRLWRQDAIMQHLYETAIFWGDKVLTWTADPNDAFWLAQAHFLCHHYLRAESILTQAFAYQSPRATSTKGKERDDLLRGNMPLMGGINISPGAIGKYSRLVDLSVACRYLAAQCSVRLGKWDDALEMLGEVNPFRSRVKEPLPFELPDQHGGVKVESTMCYLRGIIMLRMGRASDARESLMEALAIDFKNFDAFEALVSGEMMTVDEEWEFVQGLQYHQDEPYAAQFVQAMYTVRLKKYKHHDQVADARHLLTSEYGMSTNADVLLGFADTLYSQYRYADAFAITSRILEKTKIHTQAIPLHIACMQYLPHLRPSLFLLAHELMQKEPESPVSSYAVAAWYMFTKKYAMARRWISKTTLMDPRNGPAWIAFAHTFAFEGEHDQAVTAYSTCARLFRGSHLPMLYIGMEYLRISNFLLAEEYLDAAQKNCDSDPLLLNELGVLQFRNEKYTDAVILFLRALDIGNASQVSEKAWKHTYLNLGQAYRKLGRYDEAKAAFQTVITIDPGSAQGFACLGMIHHVLNEQDAAITRYHEALSIEPLHAQIIELLNLALASNALLGPLAGVSFSNTTTNAQAFIAAGVGGPLAKRAAGVPPLAIPLSDLLLKSFKNGPPDQLLTSSVAAGPSWPLHIDAPAGKPVGFNASWEQKMTVTREKFEGRPEVPVVSSIDGTGAASRHMQMLGAGTGAAGGTNIGTRTFEDVDADRVAQEALMDDAEDDLLEDASMDVAD